MGILTDTYGIHSNRDEIEDITKKEILMEFISTNRWGIFLVSLILLYNLRTSSDIQSFLQNNFNLYLSEPTIEAIVNTYPNFRLDKEKLIKSNSVKIQVFESPNENPLIEKLISTSYFTKDYLQQKTIVAVPFDLKDKLVEESDILYIPILDFDIQKGNRIQATYFDQNDEITDYSDYFFYNNDSSRLFELAVK